MNIDQTLEERGTRYGSFEEHARITQNIKKAMADSPNWAKLPPNMREALEMVAHKAGRILNGDPLYHDSWHDIVGYTKLVADDLLKHQKPVAANDNGGWVIWHGGECPVPDGTQVEYIMRDGDKSDGRADYLRWGHKPSDSDIIGYRIIKG